MAMLDEVKDRLSISGTDSDTVLQGYIDDVIAFCKSAGVSAEKLNSEYGLVARGVSDLWDGKDGFSKIFRMRLMQLQAEPDAPASSSGTETPTGAEV